MQKARKKPFSYERQQKKFSKVEVIGASLFQKYIIKCRNERQESNHLDANDNGENSLK